MYGLYLKRVLVGICIVLLAGCVTQGQNFESKVDWIKVGETRQRDVKLVLNEPFSVGSSAGAPTWTYGYYRYRLFGKSHTKELKVYWEADGTVKHYSFNSSFPTDTKGVVSPPITTPGRRP